MARPASPHTTKLPCLFCAADMAAKKAKHYGWCPVINPVTEGSVGYWQQILQSEKSAIHDQCIARAELEHLFRPPLKWLDSIKRV